MVECHLMAGDSGFLLKVVTADVDACRQFQIEYLGHIKGVRNIKTDLPIQRITLTWKIPV